MPLEYAPGIPSKERKVALPTKRVPETWEFGLHRHDADRAGLHYDVRLGDPATGHAHSWAMRKEWPEPGESRMVVQQPTHTIPYMDFRGRIEAGYGKGDVALARREKAEVVSSSPDHVRFNLYTGKNNEEYLLRRTDGDHWLLKNITTSREEGPGTKLPSSKPKYKEKKPAELDPHREDTIWQAKIDGAHVLYQFRDKGSQARVFSYRPTERATGIIEHTQRMPDFHEMKTPAALQDTILRGEITAVDKKGKALESQRVGGILNAGVWKSREKQKEEGKLVPYVFDVVRWKGKDVENAPFEQKLQMLQEAQKHAPWLRIPRTATTPEEKQKLFSDIQHHKEPSTAEGLIEWHVDKPVPVKAKFREDQDVYIRGVFKEEGQKGRTPMAGGFTYSTTPNGPIAGRVGTGFSHAMKKDLLEHPGMYTGLKARVQMTRGHAGRAPAFISLHLDQDLPEGVKVALGPYESGLTPEERERAARGHTGSRPSIVGNEYTRSGAAMRFTAKNPLVALALATALGQRKMASFQDELGKIQGVKNATPH